MLLAYDCLSTIQGVSLHNAFTGLQFTAYMLISAWLVRSLPDFLVAEPR